MSAICKALDGGGVGLLREHCVARDADDERGRAAACGQSQELSMPVVQPGLVCVCVCVWVCFFNIFYLFC